MKGHDGLCPTPNAHLKDRQHCAYCNLIEVVKDYYKGKKSDGHTYDDGYRDGFAAAIAKLQELSV